MTNEWEKWENWDPQGSIPNIAVNDIVYQSGSDDLLYLATDAGVFVKEGDAQKPWVRYGDDGPRCKVSDLKINYCAAKLRAGTWGRGLWEADLLPVEGIDGLREIMTSTTWPDVGEEYSLKTNLVIRAGATLTVKGKLSMPAKGSIIVEPGAELIVDGGTLTNFCEEVWYGVFVQGDASQDQDKPPTGLRPQGYMELKNNALVEYARNAVNLWDGQNLSSTGGVLIARNSTFKNNRRAVAFMSYYAIPPGGNLSLFEDCDFIWDDDYRGYDPVLGQVSLWDVNGISFEGCHFSNLQNGPTDVDRGSGIYAIDAEFDVIQTPLPPRRPRFEGFYQGIRAGNVNTLYTYLIEQADFIDNVKGIESNAVDFSSIKYCAFEIGGAASSSGSIQHVGLEINTGTGYEVRGNNFTRSSAAGAAQRVITGIGVHETGAGPNEILGNDFDDMNFGNVSSGMNRLPGGGATGLVYLCNTNANNDFDFFVEDSPNPDHGIAQDQGSGGQPTGNTFSFSGVPDGDFYYGAGPSSLQVNYYHDTPIPETPALYTLSKILLKSAAGNTCGGGDPPDGIESLEEAHADYDWISKQLQAIPLESPQANRLRTRLGLLSDRVLRHLLRQDRASEQVETWLMRKVGLESRYALIKWYLQQDQHEKASTLLGSLYQKYPRREEEIGYYQQLKPMVLSIDKNKQAFFELDSTQQALLHRISSTQRLPREEARNILGLSELNHIEPPHYLHIWEPSLLPAAKENMEKNMQARLHIFPNPAQHSVTLRYHIPEAQASLLSLEIATIQGATIKSLQLPGLKGENEMDLQGLSNGLYFIRIKQGDRVWVTQKLIKIN